MEGRNQFTFYRSFYEAVVKLPKSRQLDMFFAIVRYGLDLQEPQGLNAQQEGQFKLIRPILRTAWRKAVAGAVGGKVSKRGAAEKISKGEKEIEIEKEIETDTEGEGFRRFWERYPLKIGLNEARLAFARVCERNDMEFVLAGLSKWLDSEAWRRDDGRYVPKPEKWLQEEWFLQAPPSCVPNGAKGELGQAELEAIQRLLKEE